MGRENCSTCDWLMGEMYCGDRDFAYAKCTDMKECPEGLDDDDEDLDQADFEEEEYGND